MSNIVSFRRSAEIAAQPPADNAEAILYAVVALRSTVSEEIRRALLTLDLSVQRTRAATMRLPGARTRQALIRQLQEPSRFSAARASSLSRASGMSRTTSGLRTPSKTAARMGHSFCWGLSLLTPRPSDP